MFPVEDKNVKKQKFTGRSKARVIDNKDPLTRGRIRVNHPLLGDTTWVPYLKTPFGFDVPRIGDLVYLEADCGYAEYPICWGNIVSGLDESPNIPEAFQRIVPTNRGYYTPGGHLIEYDDGVQDPLSNAASSESRGVRITTTAGNKFHIAEDPTTGNQYILMQDAGGNLIELSYSDSKRQLTVNSIGQTQVATAENKTETVGGNLSLSVTGNVTINVQGSAAINVQGSTTVSSGGDVAVTAGGNATVDAALIKLNGDGGDVLTSKTAPFEDSIFGNPQIGVTTVKAGP